MNQQNIFIIETPFKTCHGYGREIDMLQHLHGAKPN